MVFLLFGIDRCSSAWTPAHGLPDLTIAALAGLCAAPRQRPAEPALNPMLPQAACLVQQTAPARKLRQWPQGDPAF